MLFGELRISCDPELVRSDEFQGRIAESIQANIACFAKAFTQRIEMRKW